MLIIGTAVLFVYFSIVAIVKDPDIKQEPWPSSIGAERTDKMDSGHN
jgi:hypothetical protein